MLSKYRSSKAFVVSFTLHIIVGVIGFFFWSSEQFIADQDSINAVLMKVEEPKTKRMNRPKRPQVRRQKATVQTNQPSLKILTSNAPVTDRGFVSAAEPTQFTMGPLNLGDNTELSTESVTPASNAANGTSDHATCQKSRFTGASQKPTGQIYRKTRGTAADYLLRGSFVEYARIAVAET